MVKVEFSNGLTVKAASMAQVRRMMQSPVRGLRIVRIDGKPVN